MDWKLQLVVVSLIPGLTLPRHEFGIHCRELYTAYQEKGRQDLNPAHEARASGKWGTDVKTSQSSLYTTRSFKESPFVISIDILEIMFPGDTCLSSE